MGVLTDLLIANEDESEKIAQSVAPINEWKGIDAKEHNDITLGALFCILQGKNYNWENTIEFPLLSQNSDDGPWVFNIPKEFIYLLAKITDDESPEIITKWLKTGELGDANFEILETSIRELRSLAQNSLQQEKDVLMWICL